MTVHHHHDPRSSGRARARVSVLHVLGLFVFYTALAFGVFAFTFFYIFTGIEFSLVIVEKNPKKVRDSLKSLTIFLFVDSGVLEACEPLDQSSPVMIPLNHGIQLVGGDSSEGSDAGDLWNPGLDIKPPQKGLKHDRRISLRAVAPLIR